MHPARQSAAGAVQPKRIDVETKLRRLRRHDRTIANVRAVFRAGLSEKPTLIRDLSDGGLGLIGADGLFPGCEIEIALVTGETKAGVVRWWLAGACGVQFHEPLGTNDAFRNGVLRNSAECSQLSGNHVSIGPHSRALVRSLLSCAKILKYRRRSST